MTVISWARESSAVFRAARIFAADRQAYNVERGTFSSRHKKATLRVLLPP
jgi:hypothetical protein